jgi:hypothetical protein
MDAIFPNPTQPPDRPALVAALGERTELWDRVAGWIEATYGVEPEPLFYGKGTGWVVRYRRSGKSLVTLIPLVGAVQATVVIGPSVAPAVAGLDLQPSTRTAFENAHPYPDGRWLQMTLATLRDADDITRLVALKSPPPGRPRKRRDVVPAAAT